jgi:hypothetical protein
LGPIFYSEFAKWDKVSALVGRAKIHVYNSSYDGRQSAMDNLEYVLSTFWDNTREIQCTIVVIEHDHIPPTDGPSGPSVAWSGNARRGPQETATPITSRRLSLISNLQAVPAFRNRVVNVEHENFETDTAAVREVAVTERYDRETDGWTRDLGVGHRFLETTYSLFVSQNESLFDMLARRVSWPWWRTVYGRDSNEPLPI